MLHEHQKSLQSQVEAEISENNMVKPVKLKLPCEVFDHYAMLS